MVKKKKNEGLGYLVFFFKIKKVEKGTIPSRNKKKPEDEEELGVGWRERQCGFTVVFENETQESRKKKRKK